MARKTGAAASGSTKSGGDALAPYQPENTVGFVLWDTSRTFIRLFSERIARHGVNFGVWPVLRALWQQDGLTQQELVGRVRMKGPTIVNIVAELERRNMVRRVRNPADKRKVNVYLTAAGRAAYARVRPEIEYVNRAGLAKFTAAERRTLIDLLKRARANVATASNGEGRKRA